MNIEDTQIKGDYIDKLPLDNIMPSHEEIKLVDTLFKEQQTTFNKIFINLKDVLILGLLFVAFSVPQLDSVVMKILPCTEKSPYLLIGAKALLFMLVYFVIKNVYLVRK
jgi:hypothetical protein